jgi:hypothetical protein
VDLWDGNHRAAVAHEQGLKSIPVTVTHMNRKMPRTTTAWQARNRIRHARYRANIANEAAEATRLIKRLPGETPEESWARHQKQIAGGVTASAVVPALLALRSGREASRALALGNKEAQALHSGMQLRHAATATALGGLAGGVNVVPPLVRKPKLAQRASGEVGHLQRRYAGGQGVIPFSTNKKVKLPRHPQQPRPTYSLPRHRSTNQSVYRGTA